MSRIPVVPPKVIKDYASLKQQREEDRDHFMRILLQLGFLESRADKDMIEHMMRHLNAKTLSLTRKLNENSLLQVEKVLQ